jgi:type I restriction enzyme R subunit
VLLIPHVYPLTILLLFTVQSIHALIKYYETFKRLNKKLEQPLTVAGIFTFKPNEDDRDGEVPYHTNHYL